MGIIQGEGIIALSGAVPSAIFWPAMNFAMRIRKENVLLRLLETALANAETMQDANKEILELFKNVYSM